MNDVKAYKDRLIRQISHTPMPPAARQKFIDKAAALYTWKHIGGSNVIERV